MMPVLLHRTLTGEVACGVVVSQFEGPDRASQRNSISTWSAQVSRTFSTVVLCQQQQVATRQRQRHSDNACPGTTLAGPRGWPTLLVSRARMALRVKRMETRRAGVWPVIDPGTAAHWPGLPRTCLSRGCPGETLAEAPSSASAGASRPAGQRLAAAKRRVDEALYQQRHTFTTLQSTR